jgi:hypothetical protein
MKPILFSTLMVQAILDGKKTMTRRVIKPQPTKPYLCNIGHVWDDGHGYEIRPRYNLSDILWIRETWCKTDCFGLQNGYVYKADGEKNKIFNMTGFIAKWKPSIFMPRDAARIFLRVTNIKAERIQDITEADMLAEGTRDGDTYLTISPDDIHPEESELYKGWIGWNRACFYQLWDKINAKPKPHYITINGKRQVDYYISYPWEDINETRTYHGKPWHIIGNPWVWVIEFEQITKEEAITE